MAEQAGGIAQRVLEFEGLTNARDLGGLPVAGGAVRPGLLLRTGKLADATPTDCERLASMGLTRVYDFRSNAEASTSPDPMMPGVQNVRLLPLDGLAPGITRDDASDMEAMKALFKRSVKDPDAITAYMTDMYARLVSEPFGLETYSRFLDDLAKREPGEGMVLWHCSAGKDRAGVAAALLLTCLGADRQTIADDYLLTNRFVEPGIQDMLKRHVPRLFRRRMEPSMRQFFEARIEYLDGMWRIMEEECGSAAAFLRERLGVDDAKRVRLRELYVSRA